MFDWVEFNPSRITEPGVIVGLILMLIGMILIIIAKPIAKKIAIKYSKEEEKTLMNLKLIGFGIVIIACLVAVLTI